MQSELTTSRGIKKAEEVEPIKSLKDIQRIKQYLLGKEDKRDFLMFVLGIAKAAYTKGCAANRKAHN